CRPSARAGTCGRPPASTASARWPCSRPGCAGEAGAVRLVPACPGDRGGEEPVLALRALADRPALPALSSAAGGDVRRLRTGSRPATRGGATTDAIRDRAGRGAPVLRGDRRRRAAAADRRPG